MSLLDEQLKLVFRALPISLLATSVAVLVLGYVVSDVVEQQWLILCLSAFGLVTLFRAGLYVAYKKTKQPSLLLWSRLFMLGAFLAGCSWGGISLWWYPQESMPHQVLVAVAIIGVVSAGAASLAALSQSFMLFLPPTILPLMYKMWSMPHDVRLAMIFGVSIFTLFMVYSVHNSAANIRQNIQLRRKSLENEKIIMASQFELEESRLMLSHVLDTIPVGVYWKNLEGVYLGCNRTFAEELGLSADAIIGKTDSELPRQQNNQCLENEKQLLQSGEALLNRELCITLDNGKLRWFNCSLIPLNDHNGQAVGLLGTNYDVTGQKRVEEIKNEFISTVSHELRTPLTSIRGAIGLMNGGHVSAGDQKYDELLKIAHNNTDRLLNLIDDLLTIQKIESVYMDFNIEPVRLDTLVSEVLQDNLSLAEHYDVKFVLERNDPNVMIQADAPRLVQVITNLMSNAAKFSYPGQSIELGVVRETSQCYFYIQDHGVGIPKEFHSRLFDRFTQWDASNTREVGGTGLGLNIVKSIVERHQGSIRFDSEEGAGTRFEVSLPMSEHQQQTAPAA